MNPEPLPWVKPRAFAAKSSIGDHSVHHVHGELRAVFGVNGFALAETYDYVQHLDRHTLLAHAFEVHLDAALLVVPADAVRERAELESGAEFSVDPAKQVLVKRSSHALRIVIGRDQQVEALAHIGAEENGIVCREAAANI